MREVVLIQPPVRDFYLTRKRTIPYGLASIAARVQASGFACTIVDGLATAKSRILPLPEAYGYLEPFYGNQDLSQFGLFSAFRHFGYTHDHLGHLAREKNPFVVGISSLFTAYADQALATAAAVRKFCPQAWVVLGGHHPTAFPDHCLDSTDVDFVIRGEGETPMALLCQVLSQAAPRRDRFSGVSPAGLPGLAKIPGLVFRDPDQTRPRGKKHLAPNSLGGLREPHWEPDLDALPLPAWDKIHPEFYHRGTGAAITVTASRGCPFGCTYCSVSARSSHGRFRQRSVVRVLQEIRDQASGRDIGFIDFEDENLTLDRSWAFDLLTGIREIFGSRLVELRAMNGLYPPSLDREMIQAMKRSGFRTLNLSVGSFSGSQLKAFGRPDVRTAHAAVLETARAEGMDTVTYIIGAGPDQTAGTSLDDLLTLAGLPTLAGLSIFYPAPGSRCWDQCRDKGILPDRFELMRSSALPLDQATSRLEAVTLLRLSRILNFLKFLADRNGELPFPQPFPESSLGKEAHVQNLSEEGGPPLEKLGFGDRRLRISTALAGWFLHDARIRGVDDRGILYEHRTDRELCTAFVNRLTQTPFMGVTTGPWRFQGR